MLLPAGTRHNVSVEFQCQDSIKILALAGNLYVFVNSRKDKHKLLKKHILKDIVPLGLAARIKEIQEQLRQAIQERDNQIQAIQHEKIGLQGEMRAKDH